MYDPTQAVDSPTRFTVVLIALVVAGGPVLGTAVAQSDPTGLTEDGPEAWEQRHKFLTPLGGLYGTDVALDGHTAIVGAPSTSSGGYIQILSDASGGWDIEADLVSPATSGQHAFGASVDVDGDLAIVGDPGDPSIFDEMTEGNAYVLEKTGSTWMIVETLSPSDDPTQSNRGFGYSVAIDAATGTALVGAPLEDTSAGGQAGTAVVYQQTSGSWTKEATLAPSDAEADDRFGVDVDLEGTTAIVGASREDTAGPSAGAAYVFEGGGTGWSQLDKLVASDGDQHRGFGVEVAIEGDRAAVGTFQDPVYVFDDLTSNANEIVKLVPDDRLDPQLFGSSLFYGSADVGFDGDTVVLGGPSSSPFVDQPGSKAFVFEEAGDGSWSQVTELAPRDAEAQVPDADGFGEAVAVDGDRALVGAPLEDSRDARRNGGAAYLFAPCDETGPVSQPVHESVEPASGPAQETVHDVNCNWVQQIE